jgi:hypothetical protein
MSTSNHLQRVHTSALNPLGGYEESTVKNCLALVDRAFSRMEEQQIAARKARAEMREAIAASAPRITAVRHNRPGYAFGPGISGGKGKLDRAPTPEAMVVIREYALQGDSRNQNGFAQRAGVSIATLRKYAGIIRSQRVTDIFPPLTDAEQARLDSREKKPGGWRNAVITFLAGSGAGAGRSEKRAAEAGEETTLSE